MSKLDDARKSINEIDKQIASLFEARMDEVAKVAEYKKEHGISIEDASREQDILRRNSAIIKNEDYKPYYVSFQKSLMDISKSFQHRLLDGMRVSFSGTHGAFADITASKIFPDAELIGYKDFKAAYNSVVPAALKL